MIGVDNVNGSGALDAGSLKIEESQGASYLVTGANRGIGRGLIAELLLRPASTVIACVRNPNHTTAANLRELPRADGSSLIVVKLDCSNPTDSSAAIKTLQVEHSISNLDVVIANAAVATNFGPTSTMTTEALMEHMQTNCCSVLQLFQATRPLLEKAKAGKPKFVFMGAPISTITEMEQTGRAPLGAYSTSKLAANWIVRKIHFENKWLISFIIDPGHVQTDMGDQGARLLGRKEAPTTLRQSVDGIIARIDEATKEASSGHFLLHEDGSKVPW